MTIVGLDKFLCIDIGDFGKNSGGIFEVSNMGKRFEANSMNISGQNEPCPHVEMNLLH